MSRLEVWRAQRAFAVRVLHLVRTEKRELAAALVLGETAKLRAENAVPDPQSVEIGGWNLLVAGAVGAAHDLAAEGKRLAVISIELVNRRYFGSQDGRYPLRDTVCLEARFYEPPPSSHARKCPRRMLNLEGNDHYLWRRSGLGKVRLTLEGAQELATFQRQIGPSNMGSDAEREKAIFLAGWLMWVRVEAAVDRAAVRRGLPFPLPVIFGVNQVSRPMESNELDYGPIGETLHFATENALPPEEHATILQAKKAAEAAKEKAFWGDLLDQYQMIVRDVPRMKGPD